MLLNFHRVVINVDNHIAGKWYNYLLRHRENFVAGAAGENLVVGVSAIINAIIRRVAFLGGSDCHAYAHGMVLTSERRHFALSLLLLLLKQGLTPKPRLGSHTESRDHHLQP